VPPCNFSASSVILGLGRTDLHDLYTVDIVIVFHKNTNHKRDHLPTHTGMPAVNMMRSSSSSGDAITSLKGIGLSFSMINSYTIVVCRRKGA
jgi:hypothetical protein